MFNLIEWIIAMILIFCAVLIMIAIIPVFIIFVSYLIHEKERD